MKSLLFTLLILSCVPCNAGTTFEKDTYPILKANKNYLSLLQKFSFHPTYVHIVDEGKIRKITTLAAYSEDGEKSVGWSNYVNLTLKKDASSNEYKLTGVEVTELGPNYPCFQPASVVTIGNDNSLVKHPMRYPDPQKLQWTLEANEEEQHEIE